MSDSNDREDSWLGAGFSDDEDNGKKQKKSGLPRRPARTKTPKLDLPPEKWYINKVNPGDTTSTQRGFYLPTSVQAASDESSQNDRSTSANLSRQISDSNQSDNGASVPQRAKVHTRSERGPNLNTKALRKSKKFDDDDDEFNWDLPTQQIPPPPPSPPPSPDPSVGGPVAETPDPRDIFDPTEEEKQKAADEYDRRIAEENKTNWDGKPLTKWVEGVVVKKTQRAMYKENTEQVKEGLKVVETVTAPPLNKFFSIFTTLLPYVVFSVSVVASFVNIVYTNANNPEFNITCLLLDLIEVIFLTINFLIHKSAWYKRKSDEEKKRFDNRQQIIDNVLAESLLYPTILCSLLGIAKETPFMPENISKTDWDGHMGRLDLILITFDLFSLTYVYGSRMYIVNTFMSKLNTLINSDNQEDDWKSCFTITRRIVYTIVLNSLLFGAMLALLGLQVYHENLDGNIPAWFQAVMDERGETELIYMSHIAVYMLMATITIPILSIIVFMLANYYYILELMIMLNVKVVADDKFRETLQGEQDSKMAEGVLGFAKKNIHTSPGRLRDIQSLSQFQKVFYVLREWWIDLLFFVWASLIVLYCYFYYEQYSQDNIQGNFQVAYIVTFSLCVYIFVFANYHSFAVVMATNVLILPLIISFGCQAIIDKCKGLYNKSSDKKQANDPEKTPESTQDKTQGKTPGNTPEKTPGKTHESTEIASEMTSSSKPSSRSSMFKHGNAMDQSIQPKIGTAASIDLSVGSMPGAVNGDTDYQ